MSANTPHVLKVLTITYGLVPIIAGLDKFVNLLTDWSSYLSPHIGSILSPQIIMPLVGVVEIAAGVLVLLKPRIGAWIVSGWLVLIAFNLMLMGAWDVAVRDLVMAVGAYALARLAR